MKKKILFSALAAVFTLIIPFSVAGCNKGGKVIKINEVTHSVFYAPLYLADALGYFEDEGYKIELTNGGGADATMAAVLAGEADVGFCGPEATVYVHTGDSDDAPMVFGQLTKRDGSFLVGRTAQPDFKWTDLQGKDILAGRAGGVTLMTFQYVLQRNRQLHNERRIQFHDGGVRGQRGRLLHYVRAGCIRISGGGQGLYRCFRRTGIGRNPLHLLYGEAELYR